MTANTPAGVTVTFNGGSGVKVTIGSDGKVKADFSGMRPVTFTAQVGPAQAQGEISYQGTTDGTVDLNASAPATTSSGGQSTASPLGGSGATPTGAATTPTGTAGGSGKSGAWRPTGTVNVNDLKITLKVTQPVAATLLNNVKVSDVTGSQTAQAGDAVDLQPLLRGGTYQCNGEKTLVITTSDRAPTVVWTLSRS